MPEATDTFYPADLQPRGARGSKETAGGTVSLKDSGPRTLGTGTAKTRSLILVLPRVPLLPCLLCDTRQHSDPLWAHLEPGNQLATGHLGPYPGNPLPQFPSLCQALVESKLEMMGGSSLLHGTLYHSGPGCDQGIPRGCSKGSCDWLRPPVTSDAPEAPSPPEARGGRRPLGRVSGSDRLGCPPSLRWQLRGADASLRVP